MAQFVGSRKGLRLVVFSVALAGVASASRVSPQAQVGNPDQQLNALRQQVAALERRISELEKTKPVVVGGKPDAPSPNARLDKLEERLANVERGLDRLHDELAKIDHSTVTAPFVVVDHAGKPVIRVTEEGNSFSRGIYVFHTTAQVGAHVGTGPDGNGRLYAATPGQLPSAILFAGPNDPGLQLGLSTKKVFSVDKGGLKLFNDGNIPVIDLNRKHLIISDDAGNFMVAAGYDAEGIGKVTAGPTKGGPPAPGQLGFPYQIVGRKGK